MTKTLEIKTDEQKRSASRSNLFIAFGKLFRFPDEDYINGISSGSIQEELSLLLNELPYPVEERNFLTVRFQINDIEDFQSEYIKTFDVSPGGPPCPLYEGLYYPDRRKIMEELMRFYEHFGLKPDTKNNELPDHISMELEFMHFLSFKEAQALIHNKDTGALLRAERDFLERHLIKWIPELIKKFGKANPPEYYRHLFKFLNAFLNSDLKYVKERLQE